MKELELKIWDDKYFMLDGEDNKFPYNDKSIRFIYNTILNKRAGKLEDEISLEEFTNQINLNGNINGQWLTMNKEDGIVTHRWSVIKKDKVEYEPTYEKSEKDVMIDKLVDKFRNFLEETL